MVRAEYGVKETYRSSGDNKSVQFCCHNRLFQKSDEKKPFKIAHKISEFVLLNQGIIAEYQNFYVSLVTRIACLVLRRVASAGRLGANLTPAVLLRKNEAAGEDAFGLMSISTLKLAKKLDIVLKKSYLVKREAYLEHRVSSIEYLTKGSIKWQKGKELQRRR